MNGNEESLRIRTRRPRLPPELIDAIINLLCDDGGTLRTCALVCRSWIPASRHHLFSQIRITPMDSVDALNILLSTWCTINSAVEHLVLEGIDRVCNLEGIACRLPYVTQLSLRDWNCALRTCPAAISHLNPILRNLQVLEIFRASFDQQGASLLLLLRHSPKLKALHCLSVSLGISVDADIGQSPDLLQISRAGPMPELRSLELLASTPVLSWMAPHWTTAAPRLTTLILSCVSAHRIDRYSVERLLEVAGSSLKHLIFSPNLHNLRE
jgi:hypothetical protein